MSSFICTICRDLLTEPREIELGTNRSEYHPVITYCGHVFHLHCLRTLFTSLEGRNSELSCPTCSEAIVVTDVVKIYPARDENSEDYQSVQRRAQRLNRENGVLALELDVANVNLHAAAEKIAETREKVEELSEQVENLQLLVKSEQEEDLHLNSQMESFCTQSEAEEEQYQYDPKMFRANVRMASNFKNILKYFQLLVNEKDNSNAANTRNYSRARISGSNVRGRNFKQEPNYEDIVKKIQDVFTFVI